MEGALIDHSLINFYRLLKNHALRSQGLSNSLKRGHASPHSYIVTHIKFFKNTATYSSCSYTINLAPTIKAGAVKIFIECRTQMATTPIKALSILSHASIKPYDHGEKYRGTFGN